MSNKSLFQINFEYLKVISDLENHCNDNQTDEVPEDLHEALKITQEEFSAKLKAYHFTLLELKGNLQTVTDHRKQMQAKEKVIKNQIDRLKLYAGQALELFGEPTKAGHKFKGDLFSVTCSRSKRLLIADIDQIPELYKTNTVQPVCTIDKESLKSDLLSGQEIEGAIIDNSTINVTFRK